MKEIEMKEKRMQALEYSRVLKRLAEPKYFPLVMKAIEDKDANALDAVFKELDLSEQMTNHLKQVMFTEPMLAAPMWG